jgi:ATP-binding cassette subfamily F protein 3
LIRTLVGELPALGGELERSRTVRVGYFAQQQVDALINEDSALGHMRRLAPAEREQALRDWLGRFGFRGDDATRPVGPMSGGERARLALAMLIWGKPQLLVLDEPTNHLDGSTRDALAEALAEFDGALLLVSHDRYLLRATVDQLVRVAQGQLQPFEGDLDDYAQWLMQPMPEADAMAAAGLSGAAVDLTPSRKDERRAAAIERAQRAAQRKPLERERSQIDRRLASLQERLQTLDAQLADPQAFQDPAAGAALARERAAIDQERASLEDAWLELSLQIEALDT